MSLYLSPSASRFPYRTSISLRTLTRPPDDDSNNVTLSTRPAKTTWTLLLYLTSSSPNPADGECAGGETVFYPRGRRTERDALSVAPEAGTVLLHKHGDECMLVCYSYNPPSPPPPIPKNLAFLNPRRIVVVYVYQIVAPINPRMLTTRSTKEGRSRRARSGF